MKKYEYKIISIRNEIQKIREAVGRQTEGDDVLEIEILNFYGADGWRIAKHDHLSTYLEREANE